MAIIMRLDRMMADRKMSLNELSERVGVANVNLSKMKTGKISAIRFSTLDAICDVLDCQPGDILEYQRATNLNNGEAGVGALPNNPQNHLPGNPSNSPPINTPSSSPTNPPGTTLTI